MIMNQLGIYGWKEADENLVLASLLTGDPLLLIGNHLGRDVCLGQAVPLVRQDPRGQQGRGGAGTRVPVI